MAAPLVPSQAEATLVDFFASDVRLLTQWLGDLGFATRYTSSLQRRQDGEAPGTPAATAAAVAPGQFSWPNPMASQHVASTIFG